MAAWLLIRTGTKQKGLQTLAALLKENSYASLKVLNIIDWMGDDGVDLIPVVQTMEYTNYELRMQDYLLKKFGFEPPASEKKKNK